MMSSLGLCSVRCLALLMAVAAGGRALLAQSPDERRIVDFANAARAEEGLQPLRWDAGLAAAARAHAARMAEAGAISHRYAGEADLAKRAGTAGAHFNLVEENIAFGPSPDEIHNGWMHSPGHHANLMNAPINRIGVAVVAGREGLYAVADYAQGVETLTPSEVEARVGAVVHRHGMGLVAQARDARLYCGLAKGQPGTGPALRARFMMRWQGADIEKLPPELERALASGQYTQAAVGACAAQGDGGASGAGFTAYRVAVLLY